MNIRFSKYKNKKSIVVENNRIRAEFISDPGGKMVSLVGKDTGYEFLVQRPGEVYREQPFDGCYTDGECSGFDDMFPTIDACAYDTEPWKGVKMADHGEVWSLPWEHRIKDNTLELSVKGMRFPYELKKQVFFFSENTLRIAYTLVNTSTYDFEFLWAGHFMFNMEEGMRVAVPDDCKEAISILTNTDRAFGEIMHWPHFKDISGEVYRADISRAATSGGFEKYYFKNKLKDGWCELHYPDSKKKLAVSFSADTVPYLGILMNENGWDNLYNIFIEPCTVCFDRPDLAKRNGQISKVTAGGRYQWYIDLTL
jgi:galactose mutarotase-like enzyme